MAENRKGTFMRWFTAILLTCIIAGGLMFAWPAYVRSCRLKRQSADMSARIERKRTEIAKLQEYQRRFRTDRDFVEMIARQNRRVFPGELVFIFSDGK